MKLYNSATPYIASFLILRKGDKIAFVLRKNTEYMDGYYGLPAGKVENNENFSTAAIREGLEETGVTIKLDDIKHVHTTHRKSEDSGWVDVYFETHNWIGEPYNAEPHKSSKLTWLAFTALPDNIVPPVLAALEAIQEGIKYSEYGWEDNNA